MRQLAIYVVVLILMSAGMLLLNITLFKKLSAIKKELSSYIAFEAERLDKRIDGVIRLTADDLKRILERF